MDQIPKNATYLEDGVYVMVGDDAVHLMTEREDGIHEIYLTGWAIEQLHKKLNETRQPS